MFGMGTGISLALWTPRKDSKGEPNTNGSVLESYLDVRCTIVILIDSDVFVNNFFDEIEHQLLAKSTPSINFVKEQD